MKTKMIQTIKKHKYLSLFILIIFLFLFVMIIIRGYHNCQSMLVLKKDVFEVEYGHPISQNPLDYVKINEYKEKKKGPPLKKTKLKLNISLDEENGYPPVGEYNATIQYDTEDKISFKIIVKDSTAPEIISYYQDEIESYEGEKINYEGMFISQDLSESELKLDENNIDYDNAGIYQLLIIAKDIYQNESRKEYQVRVKAKELNLRLHKLHVLETATTTFRPEVKGKAEKIEYSSSDEDIVSIDSRGRLIARKAGRATITAAMGKLTDMCEVTVSQNPYK